MNQELLLEALWALVNAQNRAAEALENCAAELMSLRVK